MDASNVTCETIRKTILCAIITATTTREMVKQLKTYQIANIL